MITNNPVQFGIDLGSENLRVVKVIGDKVEIVIFEKITESLPNRLLAIFKEIAKQHPMALIGMTGSGNAKYAKLIGATAVTENNAIASAATRFYHLEEDCIFIDIGAYNSRMVRLAKGNSGELYCVESATPAGKCSAGGGYLLSSLALRLGYLTLEEFAEAAICAAEPASIEARCGVFIESGMVAARNAGATPNNVAAGITRACAVSFANSDAAKGKAFDLPTFFIGGVSRNKAMIAFLGRELNVDLIAPTNAEIASAIGAALLADTEVNLEEAIRVLAEFALSSQLQTTAGLKHPGSPIKCLASSADLPRQFELAGIAIDIGSVSTKGAVIVQHQGRWFVLAAFYRRTLGQPLEATKDVVAHLHDQLKADGFVIKRIIAMTTGSGRHMTAALIGAEPVDEMSAQAASVPVLFPDYHGITTVFEVGGQDSKAMVVKDGILLDSRMNAVCAAGCGAYLENQAAALGCKRIEDFGPMALDAESVPILDARCTLYTGKSSTDALLGGATVVEIAAAVHIAAAENFLRRTLQGMQVEGKVLLQGAPALNPAMVSAFQAVTGQEVSVPESPHLTGAIGAARLAYLNAERQTEQWRGFEKIASTGYTLRQGDCRDCKNRCRLTVFKLDDDERSFITGDQCMSKGERQDKRRSDLPNFFANREALLMRYCSVRPGESLPKVGVPRALMFAEFGPLYTHFLRELGFEPCISDPTRQSTVGSGIRDAEGDPCFPIQLMHGHSHELVGKGINILFLPRVMSTELEPGMKFGVTCPLIQQGPDILKASVLIDGKGIEVVSPILHLARGERSVRQAFTMAGEKLGKSRKEAARAYYAAKEMFLRFKNALYEEATISMDGVGKDQKIAVICGRPYSIWDQRANIGIAEKVLKLGVLPVPMDYLLLNDASKTDASDIWKDVYGKQIQRMLRAMRIVRNDERMRAMVLSYFACGGDAFALPFLKTEASGKPFNILTLDAHTGEANLITRVESFLRSAWTREYTLQLPQIMTPTPVSKLHDKKVWFPSMTGGAGLLAATLRAYGIEAATLPISSDPTCKLSTRLVPTETCSPFNYTLEDMAQRVIAPGFDPEREVFFQGQSNCGPCRYGYYWQLQQRVLQTLNPQVQLTILGNSDDNGGLGKGFSVIGWDMLVASDLLYRMYLLTRPRDGANGMRARQVYDRYLTKMASTVAAAKAILDQGELRHILRGDHNGPILEELRAAEQEFLHVVTDNSMRPVVLVVGEFLVRQLPRANGNILGLLEEAGCICQEGGSTPYLAYTNQMGQIYARESLQQCGYSRPRLMEYLGKSINTCLIERENRVLHSACSSLLSGWPLTPANEVIAHGSRWIDPSCGGEAIYSLGDAEEYRQDIDAAANFVPFSCMPGHTSRAILPAFGRRYNIPVQTFSFEANGVGPDEGLLADFISKIWAHFHERTGCHRRNGTGCQSCNRECIPV